MDSIMLKKNKPLFSIILFMVIFGIIVILKPRFLYNQDGSLREFGVGYKNKTIFPMWLCALILGIICYFIINLLCTRFRF
jgi:hypothetical protein